MYNLLYNTVKTDKCVFKWYYSCSTKTSRLTRKSVNYGSTTKLHVVENSCPVDSRLSGAKS